MYYFFIDILSAFSEEKMDIKSYFLKYALSVVFKKSLNFNIK